MSAGEGVNYKDLLKTYEDAVAGPPMKPHVMFMPLGSLRYLVREHYGRENVIEGILNLIDSELGDDTQVMVSENVVKVVEVDQASQV